MKYGINTLLWTAGFDRSHLNLLPQFKQQGFDAVEIARFEFDSFPAAEARKAAEAAGLETTFCSALTGDLSIVSDDAGIRRRALDFVRRGIEVTAEVGAHVFVGPYCTAVGYLPGRRRTEDEWKRAVEGLQQLGPLLDANDVTIALEPLNRFEAYFINTAADMARLCDEVGHPRVGILFDTFHANIEEKNLGAAIADCGKHLKHVHTCENDRGIPGSGHVAWAEVARALTAMRYDGYAVIESFGSRITEIAAAACIWRDLAPSSEAIAYEGVRFLKNTFQSAVANTAA